MALPIATILAAIPIIEAAIRAVQGGNPTPEQIAIAAAQRQAKVDAMNAAKGPDKQ